MKILAVCQHYWPEPYPLMDILEELVRRGHQVHLITGVPNYPMGKIYPMYRRGRNRCQIRNGVVIHRCFTIARRNCPFFRVLNYYSFAASASLRALLTKEDYDVVFTNQTSPVMMSTAAAVYARRHGKKTVMYCMDLWPACLSAGGVNPDSLIYRLFGRISGRIYRKMDRILITSQMFREYLLRQHHAAPERIGYLPQYAPDCFSALPEQTGKKEVTDLVFAGNIGAAQSLDTVLAAADRLRNVPGLRWHIAGDGSELERLKSLARRMDLEQVIFHGRLPPEQMPALYARADAMLVTLTADEFISRTLPGKVQTCMAAGKPIIGAADGEIPRTIRLAGCGFCARAEDAGGLAGAVEQFLACGYRETLGRNARAYYEKHFTRERFFDTLERELQNFCCEKQSKE